MMQRKITLNRLSPFGRFYLFLSLCAIVLPFLPLLVASFSFRWIWPDLIPDSWWWERRGTTRFPIGWDYIFSSASRIFPALITTIGIAFCVSFLAIIISFPAAKVLAREEFRGKSWIEYFLLTPLIIPEIVLAIGILVTFINLGLAGSIVGVILVHLIPTLPYMVRILTSVFQNMSRDYEEQARVLGAGPLQTLWYVTLPMLLPGILSGALFTFLISSNIFLLTFFIGQGHIETLPTLLFARVQSGGTLDAVSAGMTIIACIPGLILLLITDKFIKEEVFAKGFN